MEKERRLYHFKIKHTITVDETHTGRVQTAEIIQNQLEAIGMKVTIQKVSHEKYQQLLQERNYQVILTGIQNGISPDVSYFFGEGNVANYENDTALQLVKDARKTINDKKVLQEIYQKLIDLYNKEIPFIGLYRNKQTLVTNQSVSGEMTPTFYTSYYHFETWKNS